MDPHPRESVLMCVSAAVVKSNEGTPMFRELAYSRYPDLFIGPFLDEEETWRIATPFRYSQLSDDNKKHADGIRTQLGLKFQPHIQEKSKCCEQFEIYHKMKTAWREHKEHSGKETVVYYQKEVGDFLETLGIPAKSLTELFQDEEAKKYDPLKDKSRFPNFAGTCYLPHEGRRPCQGLLARKLAQFVSSKEFVPKKTQKEAKKVKSVTVVVQGDTDTQISGRKVPNKLEEEDSGVFEDAREETSGDETIKGSDSELSWADRSLT